MNQNVDVAQMLMQRMGKPSSPLGNYTSSDLQQLRKYLKTVEGRDAVRASIDNVVIKTKDPNMAPSLIPHQDILQALLHSMGTSGFNNEAVQVDPSNMPEAYTGFNTEDYSSKE